MKLQDSPLFFLEGLCVRILRSAKRFTISAGYWSGSTRRWRGTKIRKLSGQTRKEQFALGHGHLSASDRHLSRPTATPENRDPLGDVTFGTGFGLSSDNWNYLCAFRQRSHNSAGRSSHPVCDASCHTLVVQKRKARIQTTQWNTWWLIDPLLRIFWLSLDKLQFSIIW